MQMVRTRASASQDEPVDPSLPPPPPPPAAPADQSTSRFLAAQTQLMNTMMQNMSQMIAQQNQTPAALIAALNQSNQAPAVPLPPAFPQSRLADFMRTRPSTFSSSSEPLDAND